MMADTTSFWTDIKRLEDILAGDPAAYCFAHLSELYRKVGLLDDAIAIARKGCQQHPEYVGGQFALGRACLEKGMTEESRAALEKVTRAVPENVAAQDMLIKLYMDAGDIAAAVRQLRSVVSLDPDDQESRERLASLERATRLTAVQPASEAAVAAEIFSGGDEDEELLEEAIALDDADLLEEVPQEPSIDEPEAQDDLFESAETGSGKEEARDPLTTGTLAELYVSQGFIERAVGIYRELLQADPGNTRISARLQELESMPPASAEPEPDAGDDSVWGLDDVAVSSEAGSGVEQQPALEEQPATEKTPLETLEQWLANIRERRG